MLAQCHTNNCQPSFAGAVPSNNGGKTSSAALSETTVTDPANVPTESPNPSKDPATLVNGHFHTTTPPLSKSADAITPHAKTIPLCESFHLFVVLQHMCFICFLCDNRH